MNAEMKRKFIKEKEQIEVDLVNRSDGIRTTHTVLLTHIDDGGYGHGFTLFGPVANWYALKTGDDVDLNVLLVTQKLIMEFNFFRYYPPKSQASHHKVCRNEDAHMTWG
ncbi:hypothetical protein L1987_57067 [Smallanthus sonchifolius]|uniref:Uncharacterized protein n=1 Tax=Smallanthus sonchifolius TaxID=185202 RepID=A0ACB9DC00_9ASTR|nr:hypothetical protein L1987_57067 [Smallanthus sonchifolius]